jgi:hypothetical protein
VDGAAERCASDLGTRVGSGERAGGRQRNVEMRSVCRWEGFEQGLYAAWYGMKRVSAARASNAPMCDAMRAQPAALKRGRRESLVRK